MTTNRLNEEGQTDIDYKAILLPKAKEQLRLLDPSFDNQLNELIGLSFSLIEQWTGQTLAHRSFNVSYNTFTPSLINGCDILPVSRHPVYSDSLVSTSLKTANNSYAIDARIEPLDFYGEIVVGENAELDIHEPVAMYYPITVEYMAGYKETVDGVWLCPQPLQDAIVALASWIYNNPTECGGSGCSCGTASNGVKIPSEVAMMISAYILIRADYGLYF